MTGGGVVSSSVAARAARAERLSRRRLDEARCAWEFLVKGEPHEDCVYQERGLPRCSREYNPGPKPEDEKLYEGTALGTLWGLNGPRDPHAWQLAGWNVTRRKDVA